MEPFEKFDELHRKKKILELTTLAGQIPNLYDDWCRARELKL